MTKSEIFKLAHSEARKLVAKGYSYAEAFKIGLRRAHNENMHKSMIAARVGEIKPKFMFLRGM